MAPLKSRITLCVRRRRSRVERRWSGGELDRRPFGLMGVGRTPC